MTLVQDAVDVPLCSQNIEGRSRVLAELIHGRVEVTNSYLSIGFMISSVKN